MGPGFGVVPHRTGGAGPPPELIVDGLAARGEEVDPKASAATADVPNVLTQDPGGHESSEDIREGVLAGAGRRRNSLLGEGQGGYVIRRQPALPSDVEDHLLCDPECLCRISSNARLSAHRRQRARDRRDAGPLRIRRRCRFRNHPA
jgi:hypothetical protein